MTPCAFPKCSTPPTVTNRYGQDVCLPHLAVAVSSAGSWVDDTHGEGGHG